MHSPPPGAQGVRPRAALQLGVALLVAFVVWSGIVWLGVEAGSRDAVWSPREFGTWGERFGAIEGMADYRFSLYATAQDGAPGGIVGYPTEGTTVDENDSHYLSANRVITGRETRVTSMVVYVPGPLDEPPHNQFGLAIYDDRAGAPGQLLAHNDVGILQPGWNAAPVEATLQPLTAYWFVYNTNGTAVRFNNLGVTPLGHGTISRLVRAHRGPLADDLTTLTNVGAAQLPSTLAFVALAPLVARRSRTRAIGLIAAFVVGLGLVVVLKEGFMPQYGTYPSGHVFRAAFVALMLWQAFPNRLALAAAVLAVGLTGYSVIYSGGHDFDEVLGGLLLATGLGALGLGWAAALPSRVAAGRASGASVGAAVGAASAAPGGSGDTHSASARG